MRKSRRKKRGHGFNHAKAEYLTFGCLFFVDSKVDGGYHVKSGAVTTAILADAEDYGPDITAERIASRPGLRPWVWWVLHLQIPVGRTFRLSDVPSIVGMSELEYLARNDLLNTAERNHIFNRKLENQT